MSNKKLSERLNQELNELGVPELRTERVDACSKLFKLPKFKIQDLLDGIVALDYSTMQKIADELEVNSNWLFDSLIDTKH